MRMSRKTAGLALAGACLLALSPLLFQTLGGLGGSPQITIPNLTESLLATYESAITGTLTKVSLEGWREGQSVGPFDERGSCLIYVETPAEGLIREFCLASDGTPMSFDVRLPGTSTLGRQTPGSVGAFTPWATQLIPPLLAGHTFALGRIETIYLGGTRLMAHPITVEAERATIDVRFLVHELDPTSVEKTPTWTPEVYAYRFDYQTTRGPLPTTVSLVQQDGAGPAVLDAKLKAIDAAGADVPPFSWAPAPLGCRDCPSMPFEGLPPVGAMDDIWTLSDALAFAKTDEAILSFFERSAEVVVYQTTYERFVQRDSVVGPLGVDHPAERWKIVAADPLQGEALTFEVVKVSERTNVTDLQRGPSDYRLPRAAWPAHLFDLARAWHRIQQTAPGVHVEQLYFNDRPDEDMFGPEPFVPVGDPSTRVGMPPEYLPWTIVVAYPDGGASTYGFSAANGQWLLVGGRYLSG